MDPKCIIWSLISIAKALNLSETKFLKNICDLSIWSKKHTRSSVFEILYSIFLKRNCRHYVKDSPVTMLGSFCSLSRVSKKLRLEVLSSGIVVGSGKKYHFIPNMEWLRNTQDCASSTNFADWWAKFIESQNFKKISIVKSGEPIKLEWIRNV